MSYALFIKGLAVGVAIAAPVGPIGVLCIRRTLAAGRTSGFVCGLGAATADTLYGCVAGFGLNFVSDFLVHEQLWLRLIGGVVLCVMGWTIMAEEPHEEPDPTARKGLPGAYLTTMLLTLTNPLTVLFFVAVFAGLGLGDRLGYGALTILIAGVFIGSAMWWGLLTTSVGAFRSRLTLHGLRWINRGSGLAIIAFGIIALLSTI